jgi:hypothetical protein
MLYVNYLQIKSYSILIVNIDDTVSISNNKYPTRLIVKHGLEYRSTARLEVSCHVLILEFGEAEYSIFTYGIKVAKGSVRVQAHHSFSVSLENFIL